MGRAMEVLDHLRAGDAVDFRDTALFRDSDIGEVYRWLRNKAPAYRDTNGLVYVSRHADIASMEHHAERYTSSQGTVPLVDMTADTSMINLDDPHHAAHRRLIVRRFTPHGMKPHNERIREVVRSCVDSFIARGSCDLVSEFAAVLPARVICELIGFPRDRWQDCERWARETISSANMTWDDPEIPDFLGAFVEFVEEVGALITERRRNPADDLISLWIGSEIDGVPMTDQQITEEAILVLDGGAETTRGVLTFGTIALLQNPFQRQRIADDPSLLEKLAVEELIRWVTPVQNMRRTVTEDHRLHDVDLVVGDQVILLYGSANRDERAIDNPDILDVGRTMNHHLAFGFGTHYCLGANLARFEIRTAYEELFQRIPDFQLDPSAGRPDDLPQSGGMFTRGLTTLPLVFTPQR
jgi:cholest-4-en-3-one 26-monooxygenase